MQRNTDKTAGPLKSVLNCSYATFIVWFELYTYTAFKDIIGQEFFPEDDPISQQLKIAVIFAAGFLTRPIGAWLFGIIADRKGRKYSLIISVLLMFMGSLLIVLIPSYSVIGVMAPVMLLISRMLQGLSVGGEYGVAATYLSETAPAGKRGLYSGLTFMTLILSLAMATGCQIVLSRYGNLDQEFVWRIPFAAGALLALVIAIYLHFRMEETAPFKLEVPRAFTLGKAGGLKELWKERVTIRSLKTASDTESATPKSIRSIWFVMGLTAAGTLGFYVFTVVMPSILRRSGHFLPPKINELLFFALLIFAAIQPVLGWLSDKVGRRPLLICFGIAGVMCTFPIYYYGVRLVTVPWAAFAWIMAGLIILSGYTSVNSAVKAELFPTRIRALGVGFPYAMAVALFGGTAESFSLNFRNGGYEDYFFVYVTAVMLCSLLVYLFMKETRNDEQLR